MESTFWGLYGLSFDGVELAVVGALVQASTPECLKQGNNASKTLQILRLGAFWVMLYFEGRWEAPTV